MRVLMASGHVVVWTNVYGFLVLYGILNGSVSVSSFEFLWPVMDLFVEKLIAWIYYCLTVNLGSIFMVGEFILIL